MELPVADVDRDHARRAGLQQAVGEAARRRADVGAVASGDVDPERVERVLQLLPSPRDEARRPLDLELDVVGDLLARACRGPATSPASTSACACERDSARPRSTSRTSRRFFVTQRG